MPRSFFIRVVMGGFAAVGASTLLQVGSAVAAGKQRSDQIAYQRAQIQQSEMAARAAATQSEDNRQRQLRRTLAAARASYAARGVEPSEGSASAVQAGLVSDSAIQGSAYIDQYERDAAARRLQDTYAQHEAGLIPFATGVSAASAVAGNLMQWSRLGSGWFGSQPTQG